MHYPRNIEIRIKTGIKQACDFTQISSITVFLYKSKIPKEIKRKSPIGTASNEITGLGSGGGA